MEKNLTKPLSLSWGKRDCSSFLLRTIKKTVYNYIRTEVLEGEPLHPIQHVYRSTESVLYILTENIQDALANKETAVYDFLDKAADFYNTSQWAIQH